MTSYATLYPALQNCLTDTRDECARSNIIWSICAIIGRCGVSSRQVCVEAIMQQSGMMICNGFVVNYLLIIG